MVPMHGENRAARGGRVGRLSWYEIWFNHRFPPEALPLDGPSPNQMVQPPGTVYEGGMAIELLLLLEDQ